MQVLRLLPIYSLLTIVWFVLLGLCGFIAILVAPISPAGHIFFKIGIGVGKVAVGGVLILFWLGSWYKLLQATMLYQLMAPEPDFRTKEVSN